MKLTSLWMAAIFLCFLFALSGEQADAAPVPFLLGLVGGIARAAELAGQAGKAGARLASASARSGRAASGLRLIGTAARGASSQGIRSTQTAQKAMQAAKEAVKKFWAGRTKGAATNSGMIVTVGGLIQQFIASALSHSKATPS